MSDSETGAAAPAAETRPAEPKAEGDELVLEPPASVPTVTAQRAEASIHVDEETARKISGAVTSFVDSLMNLDPKSPDLERKVRSISQMGHQEIRQSAEASSHFLDKPMVALKEGPLSQGSHVSSALLSLRKQIESLDPSRHLSRGRGPGRFLNRVPFGNQVTDYFRKYQSAQSNIEAIVGGLYRGQDELMRDNAAIEQEKVHLWAMKGRLEQYAYMAGLLDDTLSAKIAGMEAADPEKARSLKEDVLFYVRQKRQDILTQLSVNVQAYLSLDLIRKNNQELIKGVERATTTTVSALRTAVIAALALGNQRLVLDQISALNTTTGNIIESTSQMLRQQTVEIQQQAASATVSVEKLQAAFNNIYATIETIDSFKLTALNNMQKTVDGLSAQIVKAQAYVERARSAELGSARAETLSSELSLPPSRDHEGA